MYGTVKLGPDDFLWSCSDCSALVADKDRHDKWHRELSAHSHSTLSVIGGPTPAELSAFQSGGQTFETGPRPTLTTPQPRT